MPALSLKIIARLIRSFVLLLLVTASITAMALRRLHAGYALTDYLVNRKLGNQQFAADWLGAVSAMEPALNADQKAIQTSLSTPARAAALLRSAHAAPRIAPAA